MYFLTQMKGPHCKPQVVDSKSSLNENAQSESHDNTMKIWSWLFNYAVVLSPGPCPKQNQETVSYTCAALTLTLFQALDPTW